MNIKSNITAIAAAMSLAICSSAATAGTPTPYEVWAADQSNSVANVTSRGVNGSYLWIWQGDDVEAQANGGATAIPQQIDLHDVFPGSLVESDGDGTTGDTLSDLPAFGRLHGMLSDPQGKYMNINSFVPGGGYIGAVDGATKQAAFLFRVTQTNPGLSGSGRSLHMSFWNADGSALLLANLHGRILERINLTRDGSGNITAAEYDLGASLNVGAELASIADGATAFNGNGMVPSTVTGSYDAVAALGGSTPSGAGRQGAERPVNVIVCPIVTSTDNVYITFGGGGLLVADGSATPMSIVAEYDRATINGAGCGGIEQDGRVYLNAGASAAGSGATQSTMTVYSLDDAAIKAGAGVGVPNTPSPTVHIRDKKNTATIGATDGKSSNASGQLPTKSTRRDAHGMAITADGKYIHQADRIQNTVEVIDTVSGKHIGSYSLMAGNVCKNAAAEGVPSKYSNDPAPDLMGTTPNGDYMVVALRGPIPVSVGHNAQGACPGVGIIAMRGKGRSGEMVTVLRTTNTVDTAPAAAPGGYNYTGDEHSDPHGASVRVRVEDM